MRRRPISARTPAVPAQRAGRGVAALGGLSDRQVRAPARVAVTAAALLVLALLAGTVGTTVGMLRARRAEAAARTEAATAERYSKFLVDMFETAAPEGSKGREVRPGRFSTGARRGFAPSSPRAAARRRGCSPPSAGSTPGWGSTRKHARYWMRRSRWRATRARRQRWTSRRRSFVAGQTERQLDEPGKAESDDREALAILERAYGPNDVRVEPATTELGLLLRMSDPEQALASLSPQPRSAGGGARRMRTVTPRCCCRTSARCTPARAAIARRRTRTSRRCPVEAAFRRAGSPRRGRARQSCRRCIGTSGDYARAFEMARRGLEVDTAVSGPDHPDVGIAWLQPGAHHRQARRRTARARTDRPGDRDLRTTPPSRASPSHSGRQLQGGLPDRAGTARRRAEDCSNSSPPRRPRASKRELALLTGQVILAEIERLDGQVLKSQALAERVLADPAVRGDRRLEADARWARAYALAMQAKMEEAEAERMRALDIESAVAQGPAFPACSRTRSIYVCAGDAARAIAILREAVAKGFHDPIVLHDPAFASLRDRPDFAPIAAAVAPRARPAATLAR